MAPTPTIVVDMVARLPELQHVDTQRLMFTFSQARNRTRHGLYATLTPMRFEEGSLVGERQGRMYTVQRLYDSDRTEQMYILSFYLPRFMDTDFEDKLVTVLHELWHISPKFDGDLRRFSGRCYAHTGSQAAYDRAMLKLARKWLRLDPPESLYHFLQLDFDQLQRRFGKVFGRKLRQPKLIPVSQAAS